MTSGLLAHALCAHAAGLCVLPPSQDGLKRPGVGDWNRFQNKRPIEKVIHRWYSNPERTGIGLVCGDVSGGLELFEFEDADSFAAFARLLEDHDSGDKGLTRLWNRLLDGY